MVAIYLKKDDVSIIANALHCLSSWSVSDDEKQHLNTLNRQFVTETYGNVVNGIYMLNCNELLKICFAIDWTTAMHEWIDDREYLKLKRKLFKIKRFLERNRHV